MKLGRRKYLLKLKDNTSGIAPNFWIRVVVGDNNSGVITSNLKNRISTRDLVSRDLIDRVIWNMQVDVLESMILSSACAGIDIDSPEYKEAIETCIMALINES